MGATSVTHQGSVPQRDCTSIQVDGLPGNRYHLASRQRILAEVYGLLKPVKALDRYNASGKSRIYQFQCLGSKCGGAIVERSIHSVRNSHRDGRTPACPKCLVPASGGQWSLRRHRKVRPPEPEKMGKRCMTCGDMSWRRTAICKGCERPYAEERTKVATSTGLGCNPWMDGGPWL
jgi:hypothetical protein